MKVKIQNWDNCCTIRPNRELINQPGVEMGSEIEIEVKKGGLLLKPAEPAYTLDELLQSSTKESLALTEEDSNWLNSPPVGAEFK